VILHGSPIDAAGFENIIHFDDQAAKGGFLAAFPNGCNGEWSYTRGGSKVADQDFIREVIHQLKAEFQIDKGRVYVVGTSAGSPPAYRIACDLSNEIAAVASLAGKMSTDDCQPARTLSILAMHGTQDRRVLYEESETAIQRWTTLNGCVGQPTVTQSGITTTSLWNRCNGDVTVRLDKVEGGMHTWFGSDLNPVSGEPNANAVIWNFFSSLPPRA
jgi:polyhydroxybutyrate depolymerase